MGWASTSAGPPFVVPKPMLLGSSASVLCRGEKMFGRTTIGGRHSDAEEAQIVAAMAGSVRRISSPNARRARTLRPHIQVG